MSLCPFPLNDIPASDENISHAIPVADPNTGVVLFFCAFDCEGTMVTQSELKAYETIELAISGIGMFFAIFLVATWGLFPAKAKQKMTFWISVCSLMVTASVFIASLAEGSPHEVWCKNDNEGRTQEDGVSWCVVQGFCIIFFGLALCCWWFCSCFDIFSKLYLRKRNIQHYLKYYHWFSWGLPGLIAIILLSTRSFGFEQPRLWCFLNDKAPDDYEFVFFYGEVGVIWLVGTLLMFLVIWSILVQTRSYRRGETSGSYLKKLSLYRTPITFVLVFSVFWAIFFSFRLITVLDEDVYTRKAEAWIKCLLVGKFNTIAPVASPFDTPNLGTNFLDPPDPTAQGCGEVQTGRIPPGLLMTAVITISANSILVFIIFGIQKENFTLWYNYIKSVLCEKKAKKTYGDHASQSDSQGQGKGSIVEAAVYTANETVSTFVEMKRAIVFGIIWVFSLVTCQEKPSYGGSGGSFSSQGIQRPNRSPRLKFDQPVYNNANYTPRYYINSQGGSQTQLNQGGMNNYSTQIQNQGYDDYGVQVGQQHQSVGGWSDAFDDPLWGINVEF